MPYNVKDWLTSSSTISAGQNVGHAEELLFINGKLYYLGLAYRNSPLYANLTKQVLIILMM